MQAANAGDNKRKHQMPTITGTVAKNTIHVWANAILKGSAAASFAITVRISRISVKKSRYKKRKDVA
jgi:hypothetical protein